MNKGLSIVIATLLVSLPIQAQISEFAQAQSAQDRKSEADRLLDLGNQQYNKSYYQESIQSYQSALEIYRTLKDSNNEGSTLNNLGNVYYSLGQYQKALDFYQQSLAILQQTGDRQGEGTALNNLGEAYRMLGQFQKAIDLYQQSLVIKKQIGDRKGEGTSLGNLGNAYNSLGQHQKAIEFFQQSLAIKKQIGDRDGEGSSLNNLGLAAYTLGQYQQASDFFQQSLAIARQTGDLDSQGYSLIGLGNVYNSIGQYQQASVFFQQALTIFHQTGDRNGEGNSLNNLGLVSSNQGQYEQAIAFYQKSLGIFRQIGDRNGQGIALNNLGAIFNKLKQPELAILFYKQSVNVRESIRKDIRGLGKEEQKSYLDTIAGSYRNLADLLLRQDRILEAQQVLDLLKVQELSDYLQNVRGNSQTAQGIDLQNPEQNLIALANELNILQRKDREGKLNETEQQRLTQLVQLERDQNKQFNAFLNSPEVQKLITELRRTEQQQNINLANYRKLQKDVLTQMPNAVMLYPMILGDRLELVLINAKTPPLHRTVKISRELLNQEISNFLSGLRDASADDVKEPAQKFYGWLIKPFETELEQLKIDTIIYAPDGQLRYIPLSALYDGRQWVAEKYRVNNITAESLTSFIPKPLAQPKIFAGAFGGQAGDRKRAGFEGLPATITEVQKIASRFPNTTTLTEDAFSKTATETRANSHTILHLATHGELSVGTPEDSFILFGNGDKATISEIKEWSLSNVDLVVLSACQTGIGKKLGNGVEILGLGYQMQSAGARVAIASLWKVDDAGTQALMEAFYGELKKGDVPVAEALRKAQVTLIHSAKYKHPNYWSAFFAIGNGL
ncbi:CHAT domain-containing protein [Pseudanabaena yagii]|uniref:Tetratricopeptide repeat protein n=1 Tax=Pseudanabaena yagii GIHE-NHR1 TaxID=2722753 RepID=A0ABX1LTP9_9CYAN|nr:tetratricopeptide repeat protein [Pseudanabaena yagii]NMF59543.1 tetratricopeptide repeat protein [Pseudanabaena yagii GIHE-NHR1]